MNAIKEDYPITEGAAAQRQPHMHPGDAAEWAIGQALTKGNLGYSRVTRETLVELGDRLAGRKISPEGLADLAHEMTGQRFGITSNRAGQTWVKVLTHRSKNISYEAGQ